jgi:hypothetical protein
MRPVPTSHFVAVVILITCERCLNCWCLLAGYNQLSRRYHFIINVSLKMRLEDCCCRYCKLNAEGVVFVKLDLESVIENAMEMDLC